jgi:hypothetical protein
VAAGDPIAQALRGAADYGQRPVGVQQDRAEDGEQDEPGDAEQGGVGQPGADRRAGQDGRQGDDGQGQQAADAEPGQDEVDRHAGHRHDQRPLDDGLPCQRALLRGLDGSGLRRDRSGPPAAGRSAVGALRVLVSRHVVVHSG